MRFEAGFRTRLRASRAEAADKLARVNESGNLLLRFNFRVAYQRLDRFSGRVPTSSNSSLGCIVSSLGCSGILSSNALRMRVSNDETTDRFSLSGAEALIVEPQENVLSLGVSGSCFLGTE